jgi:UDP-N-acetylmuramate--alanine ligase
MEAFGSAFVDADEVVLTDVYAASEEPIPGATSEAMAAAIRRLAARPVSVVGDLDELVAALAARARPGDAVLTLGAGSIGTVPRRLLRVLQEAAA